jgi:hypothetical protein
MNGIYANAKILVAVVPVAFTRLIRNGPRVLPAGTLINVAVVLSLFTIVTVPATEVPT